MAAAKQFWTTIVSVLFALLASLGLATPATAAARPTLPQGEEPAAAGGAATGAATAAARSGVPVSVPAQRTATDWHTGQNRALPPTIKQRIGAEAHGSSPSVRHLGADAHAPVSADLARLSDQTDLTSLALATRAAKTAKTAAAA